MQASFRRKGKRSGGVPEGVVTLGIGLTTDHVPAIMVGVTDLSAPAVKQVPKKLEGHPVFIFEAGRVQAH